MSKWIKIGVNKYNLRGTIKIVTLQGGYRIPNYLISETTLRKVVWNQLTKQASLNEKGQVLSIQKNDENRMILNYKDCKETFSYAELEGYD